MLCFTTAYSRFRPVTPQDVRGVVSTLKDTKSFGRDISISILKDDEIFPQVLSKWINDFVSTHAYWIPLKLVGTTSNDKKEDNSDKVLPVKKYLTFDTKSL